MILNRKSIRLKSIDQNDIERIRKWRNKKRVRNNMIFDQKISQNEQEKWFLSLTNNSIYMMIYHLDKSIGLINCKEIDWVKKKGEVGIFIGKKSYIKSPIVIDSILLLLDFLLCNLKMKKLFAKVKNENTVAMELNLGLGYTILEQKQQYVLFELDSKNYFLKRAKLKSDSTISEMQVSFDETEHDQFIKMQLKPPLLN